MQVENPVKHSLGIHRATGFIFGCERRQQVTQEIDCLVSKPAWRIPDIIWQAGLTAKLPIGVGDVMYLPSNQPMPTQPSFWWHSGRRSDKCQLLDPSETTAFLIARSKAKEMYRWSRSRSCVGGCHTFWQLLGKSPVWTLEQHALLHRPFKCFRLLLQR